MHSCIYRGTVLHKRLRERTHTFRYGLYMVFLDLAELDQIFNRRLFWSCKSFNLFWFRRRDHLGDPATPLIDSVRDLVEQETGSRPAGPVRLLTNLRHFGFQMNPVSFYFVYDNDSTSSLVNVVAEVHNTPWNERYCYVLEPQQWTGPSDELRRLEKSLHVSPFMPMNQDYIWRFKQPGKELLASVRVVEEGALAIKASLLMQRLPLTRWRSFQMSCRFPVMPLLVYARIHLQAFKLFLKKVTFFSHPKKTRRESS